MQVTEGEARVALLQREVEMLSQTLLKSQEGETLLREKITSLNQTIQEAAALQSSTQGRMAALQKTLSMAEQDRRLLQVREKTTGFKQRGSDVNVDVRIILCR